MRIADFHNDIITQRGCARVPEDYYGRYEVVTALFKGKRSFSQISKLASATNSKYISFEDVGYDEFDYESLAKLKPIYVGLTWNGENNLGYGCDYKYGLKNRGINLVKRLNSSKIAVDTAHISKGGFLDIVEYADRVVNSHTCFSRVHEHKRNIEDWQIKLLVEKRGLIGATLCGYFSVSGKTCKIIDIFKQIDYFCQKFSIDNLCLGTDFYGTDFLPDGVSEDYETLTSLALLMKMHGYSDDDIDKIFYKNLSSFLHR